MICCGSYTELECVSACEPLNLGTATADGDYVLLLGFNDSVVKYTQSFLDGDPLVFNVALNENYAYTAKRINPSGAEACFKFNTYYTVINS